LLVTPEVHEPLTHLTWDVAWVRDQIAAIVADAEASVGADGLWPEHPLDHAEGSPARMGVYQGASGIAWGLAQLGRPRPDLVRDLHRRYVEEPDWPGAVPGYLCGETGILLVSYRLVPSDETADLLARAVAANQDDETLELLWGLPGTMLAALAMHELTAASSWADVWRASADTLWAAWTPRADGTHLWTQKLYGKEEVLVGAAHGFAGAAMALSLGRHLLDERRAAELDRRVVATATALATREDGMANWAPATGGPLTHRHGIRVQWCHGSPGIVASLATVAVDDEEFTSLLEAGGELTWRAGPLVKGAGLCHGTAGNGLAFLALYRRTGDPRWLDRARCFAVHALERVERDRARYGFGRHSLWTGDVGVAVMARSCIDGRAGMPTLDWV
jgi:hypothetical protein